MKEARLTKTGEEVIAELRSKLVPIPYGEPGTIRIKKIDKAALWRQAQKVSKHWDYDSLPPATAPRP